MLKGAPLTLKLKLGLLPCFLESGRVKVLFASCITESFPKQGLVIFQGVLRLRVNTFGSFFNFSVKILTSSQFMGQLLIIHKGNPKYFLFQSVS